jgi:hypothetical protein
MTVNFIMGDWVEVKNNHLEEWLTGYITDYKNGHVKVFFPKLNCAYWVIQKDVYKAPVKINKQDRKELIDFALDIRDYEWLRGLVNETHC